jgi:hypothetical protein
MRSANVELCNHMLAAFGLHQRAQTAGVVGELDGSSSVLLSKKPLAVSVADSRSFQRIVVAENTHGRLRCCFCGSRSACDHTKAAGRFLQDSGIRLLVSEPVDAEAVADSEDVEDVAFDQKLCSPLPFLIPLSYQSKPPPSQCIPRPQTCLCADDCTCRCSCGGQLVASFEREVRSFVLQFRLTH